MKYAVGDVVRVREDLEVGQIYFMEGKRQRDSFVSGMNHMLGETATITEITAGNKYRIAEDMHVWTDDMFVGLVDEFPDADIEVDLILGVS